jgi:hypothetical protein
MTPCQKTDRNLAIVSALVAVWSLYCGFIVDPWMFVGSPLFALSAGLYAVRAYRGDR